MTIASVPLSDVTQEKGLIGGPFGSSLVSKDYVSAGVPVIRGGNLAFGKSLSGEFAFVSEDKVSSDLARNMAAPGDLIFTQRGTLGQVALVPYESFPRYVISQSQMRLRVDPKIASPDYLYYACSTRSFLKQINDNAIATGVPHINLGILSRLTVPLPGIDEQRAIAEILCALDNKIVANNNLVSAADELSRALFIMMLNQPGADVPLSDTAQFVNGKAFTKNASGTGRVVVRIAELNSGLGGSTVYSDIDVADQHLARPGDLLFAWSGSLTLHRWFRPDAIINQHIFKVIPNAEYPMWLVYEVLRHKLEEFKAIAADKATTMGHIQRKHLDEPVTLPSPSAIEHNNALMIALWNQGLAAQEEILNLEATRDALLQQLMADKVRVNDSDLDCQTGDRTDGNADSLIRTGED